MAVQERGLGRGLDVLFGNVSSGTKFLENHGDPHREDLYLPMITKLPIERMFPCKSQPRKFFDEDALIELARSIQSQGIVQPVLVRPCQDQQPVVYEIVAGERRWRAAKMAGLMEIPVYIKPLSDDDVLAVSLIENLQREDLNPIEEALAIQMLWKRLSISQEDLAVKIGKSRSAVANTLRLLQLSLEVQESLRSGIITPGHARALLAIPNKDVQTELYRIILKRQLSVRDTESAVVFWKQKGVFPPAIVDGDISKKRDTHKDKPEAIKLLLQQLRTAIHPKVTMSGTEAMGRITLPYESKEQLVSILQYFGIGL